MYHVGLPELAHNTPAGGKNEEGRGYNGQKQLLKREAEVEIDMFHVQ